VVGRDLVSRCAIGTFQQPWRYAGYYHDSDTGLYYLQQRYYSPTLGRFLSKEPMFSDFCTDCGFQALLDNAPTTSPYAYAANRPLVLVDPDGRSWKSAAKWAGVVGAVGCIVATAGACAALTVAAVGISTINNSRQYRKGNITGRQLAGNVFIDFGAGQRFKAVRSSGSYIGRHTFGKHGAAKGLLQRRGKYTNQSLRSAIRHNRTRSLGRAALQTYSGQRAYSGRNGL
jgi:RHS repeat-associated protein